MSDSSNFIAFHRPLIESDDIQAVVDSLETGWITTGPRVAEFEEAFEKLTGTVYAVGVNSCTAAMHLAVAALGLKPGDEVITTPYTFVATSEAILYTGAKPVFVDVKPTDANIDPGLIEAAITSKTKGIMPVHIAGFPVEMDRVMEIARKHDLWVVEDAAHGIETQWKGIRAGAWGDAGAFSFYATKNITTAEGGMLTTDDENLADRARHLSLHGMSRDAWKRYTATGSWYYEITSQGYKYNMPDVLAALGLSQLKKIDVWHGIRQKWAMRYSEAFAPNPALRPPSVPDDGVVAWHLYPLRLNLSALRISRGEFIEQLRERGIGTSVHFIPLNLQPYYQQTLGYRAGQFPVAEAAYECEISLPLYPGLRESEVDRVIESVIAVANESLA